MANETLILDPMPPSPQSPAERRPVDPQVWKACAAPNSRIPAVGDLVYYFPDGHAEQASSPPDLSSIRLTAACALCRVAAVSLLADADTDEAYARILLDPRPTNRSAPPPASPSPPDGGGSSAVFFAKVLTPSDANNGGGFSVPRYCADSILPPLDLAAERPVQNLTIRDAHGRPWVFRHIYRGTPRRHLLTTGWSKFVNSKKLIAGDSVVFIRNRSNELYLGVRRAYVTPMTGAFVRPDEKVGSSGGFSRGVKGRVPPATIVEAVKLMELGRPFEVLHYPRAGVADFLVDSAAVDAALSVPWHQGMRIRMVVEAEDSTRTTWLQGIVSEVAVREAGLWPRSPWRMLQVRWDDPEAQQNVRYASPWQVELVSTTSYMQAPPYPASKKLRISGSPDSLSDTDGSAFFPMSGFSGATIGSLTPFLSDHGIQGARQDSYVSSLSKFVPTSTNRMFSSDVRGINTSRPLKPSKVSTELSIGSTSRSQGSSPPSQESIHDNAELLGGAAVNCPREATQGTFQLFGQLIETKQPPVGDFETKDGVGSLKLLIQ